MAEAMSIEERTSSQLKKSLKRKREKGKLEDELTLEERESRLKTLNEEKCSLIKYFSEVLSSDFVENWGISNFLSSNLNLSLNAIIAVMMEEKRCSYSKLAGEIYEKLKERNDSVSVSISIANVRASLLYVGQRIAYGVHNADVDVLEDESESCLWCWETRDMKLLPKSLHGTLKIRRVCRKKINERIIAIQGKCYLSYDAFRLWFVVVKYVISSLQTQKDCLFSNITMSKAVDKLSKVLSEADIRLLIESLAQKNDSEMVDKDAKKKGTNLIKELEKNKREAEKEKKRMDRELQKEKLQIEKEKKRLQEEAERDEKRREKEESEKRKQLKRKQEEADKEQRRKEKEEAELKKQLSVKKQASIMERFLQKSSTALAPHKYQAVGIVTSDADVDKKEPTCESVSQLMDSALQHKNDVDVDEIRKSHMNSWRLLGHSIRSNTQPWGMRQKPKTELIKELKLTTNGGPARDDDLGINGIVDEWVETNPDGKSCHNNTSGSSHVTNKCFRRKQLLQFDKSNRPAFYGIWPKKSCIVRSRHPFTKDPDLEYEIDSDEEWEEEEPGESLSDSEKEDEENLDEGSCKGDDEEESEDGFFVPDGYLSENEVKMRLQLSAMVGSRIMPRTGRYLARTLTVNKHPTVEYSSLAAIGVEIDKSQNEAGDGITYSSPSLKPEAESEECSAWYQQQKYLNNLTEHALRKNQPLVITNLMHEKTHLLLAEDLSGTLKVDQMCLQALSMRAFPGRSSVEVPTNVNLQEENQETSTSNSTGSEVATEISSIIQDSDLPKIVSVIQSCPQGINKVSESLLQRFPDVPRSHLRNKVREIADFVHNRWQVKKEILDKLGLTTTPEKSGKRTKSIATFFSKRCLPPTSKAINLCESSPESTKPGSSSQQEPRDSTKNV
ncbi:hypothetical protein KSS87_007370 [Heliosperma pusillum]|nr:hypothetical protein KSS87_007370 [Heliosperma pusillum]